MQEEQKTWSQVLNASLVAYNRSIHGTTRDAPNDVAEEQILQLLHISDNAEKYMRNNALAKKRAAKVKRFGALRRPKKAEAFRRGSEAKWNEKQEPEGV